MSKLMLGFIFALTIAAMLVPTAAPANSINAYANFDIRNKSDQCVFWRLPTKKEGFTQGILKPGESAVKQHQVVGNGFNSAQSVRIEATIEDCTTRRPIGPMRYDYIPVNSNSELSIHKQSPGVYIMRHGP